MGKHSGRYVVREPMDVVIMPNGDAVTVQRPRGFWSKRTSLEKGLVVAMLVLMVVVSVAVAVTVVMSKRQLIEVEEHNVVVTDEKKFVGGGAGQIQGRKVELGHGGSGGNGDMEEGTPRVKMEKNSTRVLCDTPTCVRVAYRMLMAMQPTQDPCQNFFRYACGGWQKLNPVDANEMHKAINMNEMRDTVMKSLRALLENDESTGDIEAFEMAKTFYASCTMEEVIEHRGFKPARQLMQQLGGLNTRSTWPENRVNLTSLLKKLFDNGGSPFFDLSITLDVHNSSRFFKVVTLPSTDGLVSSHRQLGAEEGDEDFHLRLKMNASRLLGHQGDEGEEDVDDDEDLEMAVRKDFLQLLNSTNTTIDRHTVYTYYKLVGDAKELKELSKIVDSYFDGDEVLIAEVAPEVTEFIQKMKKIIPGERSYKVRDMTGETHQTFTIQKLSKLMNSVDWKELMAASFEGEILSHDLVYVEVPQYLIDLNNLIKSYDERIVANAAIVLFAKQFLFDLVSLTEDMPRPDFCVEATKTVFPEAMSAMYLRSQQKERLTLIQNEMEFIYSRLKALFKENLSSRDWLNEDTKRKILEKADSLSGSFVGDKIFWNDTFIAESVEGVEVTEDKFFENVVGISRLGRQWLKKLSNKKVDRTLVKWVMASQPFVVNAFNLQPLNEIVVPLAILQPPYYDSSAPKYIQFGGIGTTLGHEFIHGFDNRGKMYDKNGNEDHHGWSTEANDRYGKRTKCLVDMYSQSFPQNITFFNKSLTLNVDGNFTLNENLADNGGLHLANEAYHKWIKETGEVEPLLPGIHLDQEQLFFVSTAQMYCSTMTPLAYIFLMELDEHTTDPERTNAMMMNSPAFSKAFQCPLGSPMNPVSKCNVW